MLQVDSLELKTNVLAAYVSASLASEIPALMTAMKVNSKQSFELGFNKACGLAEVGELAAAENELRLALKLGESESPCAHLGCFVGCYSVLIHACLMDSLSSCVVVPCECCLEYCAAIPPPPP